MKVTASREATTRAVLIVSMLLISWLGMMVVHEAGHVVGAWITGGTVTNVVLHPLVISRTDVEPNPSPRMVVWAGPVVGVVAPLLIWGVSHKRRWSGAYLLRFFAGFCCVANGAYLGAGIVMPVGDAQVMLHHGTPGWLLVVFAVLTVPMGLLLWHGEGRHFGLGKDKEPLEPRHVRWVIGLLVLLILGELWHR